MTTRQRSRNRPERAGGVQHLLDVREVAAILGVRPKRVYELDVPCVRLSERSLRWRPEVVAQWILEREGVL